MDRLSFRAACACSAASLAVGIIYFIVPNDLIPDSQPWGRADDALVMMLSIYAAWAVAPTRLRSLVVQRVAEWLPRPWPHLRPLAAAGLTDDDYAPKPRAALAKGTGYHRQAEQAAQPVGTLYGRIFLDICRSNQNNWSFSRNQNFTSFFAKFTPADCLVAYTFATGGGNLDIDALAETAVGGARPGAYPRIMKLYAGGASTGEGKGEASLRAHVRRIAGKSYFIIPSQAVHHDRIRLGGSYEGFLDRLGRHSRRNMRLARRQAAQGGMGHIVSWQDTCPPDAMRDLLGHTYPTPFNERTVAAIYRLIGEHGGGFHSVLTAPGGTAISCCSGFTAGNTAFIIHQMNHRDYLRHNPSLTNRAFLIESLIGAGIEDVVFIKGCRGILQHACEPESGKTIWIIRRSFGTLVCGALLLAQFPLAEAPEKLRAFMAHVRGRRLAGRGL